VRSATIREAPVLLDGDVFDIAWGRGQGQFDLESAIACLVALVKIVVQSLVLREYMGSSPTSPDKEYRLALVSQEPTLYAEIVRFNTLLGAIKPQSKATQPEDEPVGRDANILDFEQVVA
jgi:hypothetical protein